MPYNLDLHVVLKRAGWKVKIYDLERLEPPHATILCKERAWRLSLRDMCFLDQGDSWSDIDPKVKSAIEDEKNWEKLRNEWNRMHPANPIAGQNDE